MIVALAEAAGLMAMAGFMTLGAAVVGRRIAGMAARAQTDEGEAAARPGGRNAGAVLGLVVTVAAFAMLPVLPGAVEERAAFSAILVGFVCALGTLPHALAAAGAHTLRPFHTALRVVVLSAPFGLSIIMASVCAALASGSFALGEIAEAQRAGAADFIGAHWLALLNWAVWPLFPVFALYAVSAFVLFDALRAQVGDDHAPVSIGGGTVRLPAPQTLFIYGYGLLICGLATTLFFGGGAAPFAVVPIDLVPEILWFVVKTLGLLAALIFAHAVVNNARRLRLLRMGWTVVLPTATGLVFAFAVLSKLSAAA